MRREKVHVLQFPKRPAPRESGLRARMPTDLLILLGLGVAFLLAHYSDKPPLVEQPISLERSADARIAERSVIGLREIDSGLRGFER